MSKKDKTWPSYMYADNPPASTGRLNTPPAPTDRLKKENGKHRGRAPGFDKVGATRKTYSFLVWHWPPWRSQIAA